MLNERQIIEQFANTIVPEMQSVSKRFAPSFETLIEETEFGINLNVLASKYIRVLIDGRKPTRIGAPKGNPTLQKIILEWIKDKGIIPRAEKSGVVPTIEQLSWKISKSIHLHGTRLYQQGGGNEIFEPIITETRINSLLSQLEKTYYIKIESDLVNRLRKK